MSVLYSSAVWSANIGDPVAKLVLLKLADNANDEGRCWPSVANISAETELCERTIQTKIRAMEKLGVITASRGMNCADYSLKLDVLKALSTPQEMHPAGDAPRRRLHPRVHFTTSHPAGDAGGGAGDAVASSEPSRNHQGTIKEPSERSDPPFPSKEFLAAWSDWEAHRRDIKKKLTPTSVKMQFSAFVKWGEIRSIQAIHYSIRNGWTGIFEDKNSQTGTNGKKSTLEKETFFDDSYEKIS